jgi:serine/threonine-protein kinase
VPVKFWKLLAYYLAASTITSIVWAKYFAPERVQAILKMNTDILYWFDGMKNPIPTWYFREFS